MNSSEQEQRNVYNISIWRPDNGYEWIDHAWPSDLIGKSSGDSEKTGPYLVSREDSSVELRYNPLEENNLLFTEFVELYEKQLLKVGLMKEILRFANKYGSLGIEEFITRTKLKGILTKGEHLKSWITSMRDMWLYFKLWRWIDNGNLKKLAECIKWQSDKEVRFDFKHPKVFLQDKKTEHLDRVDGFWYREIIANKETSPEVFKLWKDEPQRRDFYQENPPVVGPAKLLLAKHINRRLLKEVSPQMLIDSGDNFRHYIVPRNLLATMWLQFFDVVNGKNTMCRCVICNKWMDTSSANRNKKKHEKCSNRERQARFRERQRSSN